MLVILCVYLFFVLFEEHVGIAQEDKAKYRLSVFVGSEMRSRAKYVGRMPQTLF